MADTGRPEITEEQYHKWFDDLAPFFKLGETLNEAIEDAGLTPHRASIYKKSKLNGWFLDRMTVFQSYPGKIANKILVKRAMMVEEKIRQGLPVSKEEMDDVKFIAEKHRSSALHFVTRVETATAKSYDELVDELETEVDTINDVATEAKKQVVATTLPVQNQEQTGPSSPVPAQPNADQTPH